MTWQEVEDGDCVLHWRENGGPTIGPTGRKGFGTALIERSIPYDLGGTSSLQQIGRLLRAPGVATERVLGFFQRCQHGLLEHEPAAVAARFSLSPAGDGYRVCTPRPGRYTLLLQHEFEASGNSGMQSLRWPVQTDITAL